MIDFCLYDPEMGVDAFESTRDGCVVAVILAAGQLYEDGRDDGGEHYATRSDQCDNDRLAHLD
jgi:hypothetical protein